MSKQITTFSTLVLAMLFVALPSSLIYSRWMRTRLLPSVLRYMPPEANVLVGVGDIASLWDGMEFHFGRVIRETEHQEALAENLAKLNERLGVKEKADLVCRYGIDINRGVLFSARAHLPLQGAQQGAHEPAFIAVIPVANDEAVVDQYCDPAVSGAHHASETQDTQERGAGKQEACPGFPDGKHRTAAEEKLVRFFCSFFALKDSPPKLLRDQINAGLYPCNPAVLLAERRADRSWIMADHAYGLGEGRLLVFPRPDTAVLSNSCEFLNRGLAGQERNLSYARADDALFEAVRYQLRRPLLLGPGALVYVRELAADFAPVGTAAAAVNLVPDALLGDVKLRTAGVNSRIVKDLLAAPNGEQTWREFFDADNAAVLVLRDDSMRRYIDFASNDPGFDAELKQFLGGVLEPARRLDHLEQIVLSGTDYRDGLPLLVLGIWGSKDELAQMVFETQRRLRQSRDETLLQGALRDHPPKEGEGLGALDGVIRAASLANDPMWFKRFRLQGAALQSEPLTREDFNGQEYLEAHGRYQIRYLEPPITQADLKYRLSADADVGGILLENRYRLASTITDNILWVGTGKHQLLRIIERPGGARAPDGLALGVESDNHGNKLRVLVNAATLIKKGMLSGESEVLRMTDQFLLYFRYHREIIISLKPTGNGQELRMEFAAHGPTNVALPIAASSKIGEAPVE